MYYIHTYIALDDIALQNSAVHRISLPNQVCKFIQCVCVCACVCIYIYECVCVYVYVDVYYAQTDR